MIPLFDRLIVKQHKVEDLKKGGVIVAAASTQKKPPRGDVLNVGPDVKCIKIGDRIQMTEKWFQPFVGADGLDYIVVDEKDVIGILEDGDA